MIAEPGQRWKFAEAPTVPYGIGWRGLEGATATVVSVVGESQGAKSVELSCDPYRGTFFITLLKLFGWAELIDQACAAGCGPAKPCMTSPSCPGHRPECSGKNGNFNYWAALQEGEPSGWAPMQRSAGGPRGPEPFRSGSGALACDWILRG